MYLRIFGYLLCVHRLGENEREKSKRDGIILWDLTFKEFRI